MRPVAMPFIDLMILGSMSLQAQHGVQVAPEKLMPPDMVTQMGTYSNEGICAGTHQ